jgi:nitroimidazol reductase NimA-like FMN-containing flavoprotein (pyridoxamine 5'-phosphate oxidase superfamily)
LNQQQDPGALARAIIDSNLYMVLGTADEAGRPWVSPVFYASAEYREFFWISDPEATHSRNLANRPEISIVIFDSQVPANTGQGVYMSALADEPRGADFDRGLETFSRRSEESGAGDLKPEDVRPPARHLLYRATATEHSVLDASDRRIKAVP